jgi:hypothetical protein
VQCILGEFNAIRLAHATWECLQQTKEGTNLIYGACAGMLYGKEAMLMVSWTGLQLCKEATMANNWMTLT